MIAADVAAIERKLKTIADGWSDGAVFHTIDIVTESTDMSSPVINVVLTSLVERVKIEAADEPSIELV